MELKQVKQHREEYMPLLLLADEEQAVVNRYLHEGDLFELREEGQVIGVALCLLLENETIEIKNIAVDEAFQGRGYGKWIITQLCRHYEDKKRIIVGTANSSIGNIAFYQKLGYTLYDVKWFFFTQHYTEEIIEDGIIAKHMLMFEQKLT